MHLTMDIWLSINLLEWYGIEMSLAPPLDIASQDTGASVLCSRLAAPDLLADLIVPNPDY
jgi:hypothetical protein